MLLNLSFLSPMSNVQCLRSKRLRTLDFGPWTLDHETNKVEEGDPIKALRGRGKGLLRDCWNPGERI